MGALRAAELHVHGMIGIGRVFEMFHLGELFADDEVAMVYDDESGRAHSVPMVNIRVALEGARKAAVITVDEEHTLVRLIQAVYFPERTDPMMFKMAADAGALSEAKRDALKHYLKTDAPDAKRDDGFVSFMR